MYQYELKSGKNEFPSLDDAGAKCHSGQWWTGLPESGSYARGASPMQRFRGIGLHR